MFLNTGQVGGAAAAAGVQTPAVSLGNSGTNNPIYSGIRWDSDGKIYRMSPAGSWNYSGEVWLLDGLASDYWLFRTINIGSLSNDDGDGNQLNTDNLDFWVSNAIAWFEREAAVTFSISDDSAGSNIIATRQYNFVAYREGTGSPP